MKKMTNVENFWTVTGELIKLRDYMSAKDTVISCNPEINKDLRKVKHLFDDILDSSIQVTRKYKLLFKKSIFS